MHEIGCEPLHAAHVTGGQSGAAIEAVAQGSADVVDRHCPGDPSGGEGDDDDLLESGPGVAMLTSHCA